MSVYERLNEQFKTNTIDSDSDVYVKDIPEDIFFYLKDSVTNLTDGKKMYVKNTSPQYETLGLTYNPALDIDGEEQYSRHIGLGINGRDDSHCFVKPLPHSEFLYSICEYTPLKAKISRMEGRYVSSQWHIDEPLDECIRVVIPIVTDPQCYFQIDNRKPVNLETGYAYFFDASFFHRYIFGNCDKNIVHLVFCLSSKYDYDYSTGEWADSQRDYHDLYSLIDNSVIF